MATKSIYKWFICLIEKLNIMIEDGDCVSHIDEFIIREGVQLRAIIDKYEHELTSFISTDIIISKYYNWNSFYYRLHNAVTSQIDLIKTSITKSFAEDNKSINKIDVCLAKDRFEKIVDSELTVVKEHIYEFEESISSKAQKDLIYKELVYESIETAQEEIKKSFSHAISITQKKFSSWFIIFFKKIRNINIESFNNDDNAYKEIEIIINTAITEVDTIIKESKSLFNFKYAISGDLYTKIAKNVENSQKQAFTSLDIIYTLVTEQIFSIKEAFLTADAKIIEENGKAITWVKNDQILDDFKDVKIVAFDLIDTVVNYRSTISKAWYKLANTKKNACSLTHIDVDSLIIRWYYLYLEQRLRAIHSEMDITILIAALKIVLSEFSIESSFNESDFKTLSSAWFNLELFEDASSSIRKIKQLDGIYVIAISHSFTISTLMSLARSGCLCWHAQFTADMFAACAIRNCTSPEESVISNTAMLLGLKKANELAIISSNPDILKAAKAYGSKAVFLSRFEDVKKKIILLM
ncbi:uncharacterized protein BX663DRAFT_36325 [Cokeromyces recurvatus]|uniref:uncharacterized protein n=1 Tax=Cokeromyces recurvatus TaxID=90255 RepID=UPI00221FC4F8|nr:uncharacterized protein BX663DRAFT_36325 [Cokeromyces recurvatus]KAI7903617.1 hypothetical protein BX663DRAFT_36325 [Cokeromyces recurvatus]